MMHRAGWRNDSTRHSLAAQGIKTKQNYFAFKDVLKSGVASGLESSFKDPGEDEKKMMRMHTKDRVRQEILLLADKDVKSGKITMEKLERFMGDDFVTEARDYENQTITADAFRDNVMRRYKHFSKIHSNTFSLWGAE